MSAQAKSDRAPDHPYRRLLSAEMHMRKLPAIEVPAHVVQFVFVSDKVAALEGLHCLYETSGGLGDSIAGSEPFQTGEFDGVRFCWEAHSEFCTYTLISEPGSDAPFDLKRLKSHVAAIGRLPGEIIRSTQIAVLPGTGKNSEDHWQDLFHAEDLVISDVSNGRGRVWCDFRLHPDGFGRMLVEDVELERAEITSLVQRLQELGNYRKMALLGLPVAKDCIGRLDILETELAELAKRVSSDDIDTEFTMQGLNRIGSELAQMSAATRYRMSATKAYSAIVDDRLEGLEPSARPGQISLSEFTERRLSPATRTCEAFGNRLRDLARNTAEISGLLRTRIDSELARKNQELLSAMNRRTELQLRLQQTVEGFSIVAITYYVLGIWKYLSEHGPLAIDHQTAAIVLAALAVVSPLAIWLLLHRARRTHRGR